MVDAGRGGAVIGPECGRGGGNKAAGWRCAKASAGGDCGASGTLPCGAAPDRGVDDVVCTGPAAPCAGPEPAESSAGSGGRAPGASCGQAALPDRCLFLRLARRRPRAVRYGIPTRRGLGEMRNIEGSTKTQSSRPHFNAVL